MSDAPNPAQRVIQLLGGPKKVGEIVGRHPNRVSAWRRPRSQGGADGRVPTDCQQRLLDYARAHGLALTPADFFDSAPATPPNGVRGEGGAAVHSDPAGLSDDANTLTGASRAQVAA